MFADSSVRSTGSLDIAALMALINLLKASFMDRPEIYRSLLAMLQDYDSGDNLCRQKILRYLKLLITDQMLLKSLLMSLPDAGSLNRPRLVPKTLPKAEKILLPPKVHENTMRCRKFRYGSGLHMKAKRLSHLCAKKFLHPFTSSTVTSCEELSQGLPVSIESTCTQEGRSSENKGTDNQTSNDLQREELESKVTSKPSTNDAVSEAPASQPSTHKLLQKSDDPKQLMTYMVSTSQGQGQFVPQQYVSPVANSIPFQYQCLPYTQAYPGLIRYPAGMTMRPVVPWQPVNMYQSAGFVGQITPSAYQQGDMMSYSEAFSGMDLSLNTVKSENEMKPSVGNGIQRRPSVVPLTSRRMMSVDELLSRKQESSKVNVSVKSVGSLQNLSQVSVCKESDPFALKSPENESKLISTSKGETNNLEALSELTSSIGRETKPSADTRIFIGAKNSASNECLPSNSSNSEKQSTCPIMTQRSPVVLNAHSSAPLIGQNFPNMTRDSGNTSLTENNKVEDNMLMKSFPYSQEIKLPDGKYYLLNSSVEKKIISLRSDERPSRMFVRQPLKGPFVHGLTFGTGNTLQNSMENSLKLPNFENNNISKEFQTNKRKSTGSIDVQKSLSSDTKHGLHTNAKINSPSVPKGTVDPTCTEEKKCTIHIHNKATNKLITELLRKRAMSEYTVGSYVPVCKKTRAMSDSVLPPNLGGSTQSDIALGNMASNLKPYTGVVDKTNILSSGSVVSPLLLNVHGLPVYPDIYGRPTMPSSVNYVTTFPTGVHNVAVIAAGATGSQGANNNTLGANGVQTVTPGESNIKLWPNSVPSMPLEAKGGSAGPSDVNGVATAAVWKGSMAVDDKNSCSLTCTPSDIPENPCQSNVSMSSDVAFNKPEKQHENSQVMQNTGNNDETPRNKSKSEMGTAMAFDQSRHYTQTDGKLVEALIGIGYQKQHGLSDGLATKGAEGPDSYQKSDIKGLHTGEKPYQVGNAGDFRRPTINFRPGSYSRRSMSLQQLHASPAESTSTNTSSTDVDFDTDEDEEYYDNVFIS